MFEKLRVCGKNSKSWFWFWLLLLLYQRVHGCSGFLRHNGGHIFKCLWDEVEAVSEATITVGMLQSSHACAASLLLLFPINSMSIESVSAPRRHTTNQKLAKNDLRIEKKFKQEKNNTASWAPPKNIVMCGLLKSHYAPYAMSLLVWIINTICSAHSSFWLLKDQFLHESSTPMSPPRPHSEGLSYFSHFFLV